jgi:CheY-like chemotaxis protein
MYQALVADDNYYNRDVIETALQRAGFQVTLAEDGRQAVERLDEQVFHVVVVDLNMPFLTGLQVLEHLVADERHNNTYKIIVTANPHMADGDTLADFILYKPLEILEFIHFMERLKDKLASG